MDLESHVLRRQDWPYTTARRLGSFAALCATVWGSGLAHMAGQVELVEASQPEEVQKVLLWKPPFFGRVEPSPWESPKMGVPRRSCRGGLGHSLKRLCGFHGVFVAPPVSRCSCAWLAAGSNTQSSCSSRTKSSLPLSLCLTVSFFFSREE